MSRFFANAEEEENSIKSDLEEIQEEKPAQDEATESKAKKKKKKKKKKKDLTQVPAEEEIEEEKEEKETKKKKKKKKKKGNVSLIQKKVEEKRRLELEIKNQNRILFHNFVVDFRRVVIDDVKEFAQKFKKRIENKKKKEAMKEQNIGGNKKEREKLRRAELARKQFEMMNVQFEQKMGNTTTSKMKLKNKKKKRKESEKIEQEQLESQQEEEKKEEVVEKNAEELKKENEDLDDWENMLDSGEEEEEEKPEPVKEEPKPEPIKQPVKKEPSPEPKEVEEIVDATKFNNPLDFFNIKSKYRCPIICIMGHVDTGKTKILDNIRKTNVQGGEAGGITQQIGASFFPAYKLKEEVTKLDQKILPVDVQIPGYLVIDTPGHESFANLRSRGSSLCDLAIVVIDIMHSLENQTIESLNMLIERKTPFVIALNKIDRLFDWVTYPDGSSHKSLIKQKKFVKNLFNERLMPVLGDLGKLSINAKLYWENDDPLEYVPIIPTSAITGEGMPDLLGYIAHYVQTYQQKKIKKNLVDFKATVLEVKKIEGMGATTDIILVDGTLKVDDKVVLSGFHGPIKTTVKALLTPHPMKEMRVKNEYLHHKKAEGSMGVKLMAQGLENALAGTSIYKYDTEEECEEYCEFLKDDIKKVKKIIRLKKEGVGVAASTLGSLEALLQYLKQMKIPVSTVCIGDVSKNDLFKILTPFNQDDENKCKKREYLSLLAFDVKLLPEAIKFADDYKIKVITAKIIYHLFDGFTKHVDVIKEQRKKEEGKKAIFPCVLKQVDVFNKKDPIILGVDVIKGVLRPGTPVCTFNNEKLKIGIVETIEVNKKSIKEARKKTGSVAIRIKGDNNILHGRQFNLENDLVSMITRQGIDTLKDYFRDDMLATDWNLIRKLKPFFNIN